MTTLGEGHFSTPITPLAGEIVLWAGGAGRYGRLVRSARVGSLFAIPVLFMLGFCGLFLLVPPSDNVAPKAPSTSAAPDSRPAAPPARSEEIAARRQTVRLVAATLLGGLALLVIGAVFLEATLVCRNAWYVVTNERICIQTGALSRCLTVIDLDKVLSVQVSSSWLERMCGLQSIELVHGGMKLFAQYRWLVQDPFVMALVPTAGSLASDLVNSWLPRDDRARRP
jgi:hypothetical protein